MGGVKAAAVEGVKVAAPAIRSSSIPALDGASGDTRTSSSVTDLTGDSVGIRAGDPNLTIASVVWRISTANVYSSQNVNYRTGFTNNPFDPATATGPNISYDWGETPGTYTVTATVTYDNPNVPATPVDVVVSVVAPTGSVTVSAKGTPAIYNGALWSAANGSTGVSYTAAVDPTIFQTDWLSGTLGVIQTMDPFTVRQYMTTKGVQYIFAGSISNPAGGPKTIPRPVVDDAYPNNSFAGTFYLSQFVKVNLNSTTATAVLPLYDTPAVGLPGGYPAPCTARHLRSH